MLPTHSGDEELRRLHEELDRAAFQLFAVNEAMKMLGSVRQLPRALELAVDMFVEMTHAPYGCVVLLRRGNVFAVQAAKGEGAEALSEQHLALPPEVVQWFEARRAPEVLTDVPNYIRTALSCAPRPFALWIPLLSGSSLVGLVALGGKLSGAAYRPDELQVLSTLAAQTAIAIENTRKEQEITHFLQEEKNEQEAILLGKHAAVKKLRREMEALAPLESPVLIQGEPGVGKELVARLIHSLSPRREGPLLRTECAYIAETPWGDKLFGAYQQREAPRHDPSVVSYLSLAEGGSLLLKNVDALPFTVQERLARVLSVDSTAPGELSRGVRVIATCRGSLTDMAKAAKVSPVLAKVLLAHVIDVPPVRERKRDIPELASHFLRKHAKRLKKQVEGLDDHAVTKLVSYDYRIANLRELEEAVERAVILADDATIGAGEILVGPPPQVQSSGFNLLGLPERVVRLSLRAFPLALQGLAAMVFVFILYLCFFAQDRESVNLGTTLVWRVWWPALALSLFFVGRMWCAFCPMAFAGIVVQRLANLKWHIPAWLQSHDTYLMMAGFFGILWLEEATGMRHAPRATGFLLVSILAGAVVTSLLFPRRTWCRHLCPLGGFAGVCASSGLVELRPTVDVCAAKCDGHACYKGIEKVAGCPMFNHVMFLDSNCHCVLCMNCVRSCPNDSPQLNVRIPARELWTVPAGRQEIGIFTAMLAGLLIAVTLIHTDGRPAQGPLASLVQEHRLAFVTVMLSLGAGLPILGALLWSRRLQGLTEATTAARRWRRMSAWVPLVTSGFVSYHLGFVPEFEGLRAVLIRQSHNGAAVPFASLSMLSAAQFVILLAGLAVTAGVMWKLSGSGEGVAQKKALLGKAVNLAGATAYWAFLLAVMLRAG